MGKVRERNITAQLVITLQLGVGCVRRWFGCVGNSRSEFRRASGHASDCARAGGHSGRAGGPQSMRKLATTPTKETNQTTNCDISLRKIEGGAGGC